MPVRDVARALRVWENAAGPAVYFVYILSSASRVLYTGVTGDLERRTWQHKCKLRPGFTQKYNTTRLVHFEMYGDIRAAISREKEIKGWRRSKKTALIASRNPRWCDLSADLFASLRHCRKPES